MTASHSLIVQTLKAAWLRWLLILALGLSLAACSSPEEKAQAHYQSGQQLLDAGDFIKAGLEFRNALKYNDKLPTAWFGLASVEEKKQNWPAVLDSLQRVVELDPKNFDALFKLAKLQLAANQLDLALKSANSAKDIKGNDTNVLALRAAILFRLNDREGARRDAEGSLALNPDNPDALAVLAADQIRDNNTTAALRFIDRGLSKDANNLGLLMFKLKIYEDAKDDPKLEAVLRQIIAANPAVKEMRQALLAFLVSRKRNADVEAELRAWMAADPKDSQLALDFIRVVGSTKGAAAARSELERLIAADPDQVNYKFALAQLDIAEKKNDTASATLEAIIARDEPKEEALRAKLLLANLNIQLSQVDKAKALIAEVLNDDEKNADALALRANLSIEGGDLESAVADLREALNQQPNSVPLLMLLGRAHERQGAVDLAKDRMAQAAKASNYAPQVALDYVAFLGRRNDNTEAEKILSEAVARNASDPRLLKALAQLRLNRQDWVGAQNAAEALKKSGDISGISAQIMGAVQLAEKKFDESIETLRGAYTSAPNTAQPMYALVVAYLQAGKASEAEAFLQSILAANPSNADALVLLGAIKETQKLPQEAEAFYKLAITRQPGSPVGYVTLAKHHLLLGQAAEAEAVLKAGREKAPTDLSLNLILAGLYENKNDPEGAIALYEAQLKATPDAIIVINNLASLLADFRTDADSLERAHQLAQRLAAIEVPQFKDTVGWVAYRRGDYRTALLNLEQATEKLPDLALVKYHLAMTYAALKRNADARDLLTKTEALLRGDDPLKEKIRTALANLAASN